jgi:hypothetical protein
MEFFFQQMDNRYQSLSWSLIRVVFEAVSSIDFLFNPVGSRVVPRECVGCVLRRPDEWKRADNISMQPVNPDGAVVGLGEKALVAVPAMPSGWAASSATLNLGSPALSSGNSTAIGCKRIPARFRLHQRRRRGRVWIEHGRWQRWRARVGHKVNYKSNKCHVITH